MFSREKPSTGPGREASAPAPTSAPPPHAQQLGPGQQPWRKGRCASRAPGKRQCPLSQREHVVTETQRPSAGTEPGTETRAERGMWRQRRSWRRTEQESKGGSQSHLRTKPLGQAPPCGAPVGNQLQWGELDREHQHRGLGLQAGGARGQHWWPRPPAGPLVSVLDHADCPRPLPGLSTLVCHVTHAETPRRSLGSEVPIRLRNQPSSCPEASAWPGREDGTCQNQGHLNNGQRSEKGCRAVNTGAA